MTIPFIDNWLHKQKLKKEEQKRDLKIVGWDRYKNGLNAQQYATEVAIAIREQEVELANKITDLQFKRASNEIEINSRQLNIKKELEELERVKAEFKVWLQDQQLDMYIKEQRFYREQDRADKQLENDFTLELSKLKMEFLKQNQDHEYRMATLDKQQNQERLKTEENRTEDLLRFVREQIIQQHQNQHAERMRDLELQILQEQARIRTMDINMQGQAYRDLHNRMHNQMRGFNNESFDLFGTY